MQKLKVHLLTIVEIAFGEGGMQSSLEKSDESELVGNPRISVKFQIKKIPLWQTKSDTLSRGSEVSSG